MHFFVRSDRPVFRNIFCQTQEQAEQVMDDLKTQYPSQEFTVEPSGETAPGEFERTPAPSQQHGYRLNRPRANHPQHAVRGDRGPKSGGKGGIPYGGRKRNKKRVGKG
jgi:hypothetical protein